MERKTLNMQQTREIRFDKKTRKENAVLYTVVILTLFQDSCILQVNKNVPSVPLHNGKFICLTFIYIVGCEPPCSLM